MHDRASYAMYGQRIPAMGLVLLCVRPRRTATNATVGILECVLVLTLQLYTLLSGFRLP